MSATTSAAIALDYSGGPASPGSLFVIDFDMTSLGADLSFLGQYPHEKELLFPPETGLCCKDTCILGGASRSLCWVHTPHPSHAAACAFALLPLTMSPLTELKPPMASSGYDVSVTATPRLPGTRRQAAPVWAAEQLGGSHGSGIGSAGSGVGSAAPKHVLFAVAPHAGT